MLDTLVFATVLLPFLVAAVLLVLREQNARKVILVATAGVLALASLAMLRGGAFILSPAPLYDTLVTLGDFVILFVVLAVGFKRKNQIIIWLTAAQILGLVWLDFFMVHDHGATPAFFADDLSLIMVLIISIVGSLIAVYGIGYMKEHEEHLHLPKSRQPRFFFFIVLFLGAMNGLVLANNLLWMYFFWECTTLCSFMLIGHDDTEIARKNAERALWMNVLGGTAFLFGLIILQKTAGTLSLQDILAKGPEMAVAGGAILIPMFLLVFAGMTKAAQAPFQSWLTGAMVAPTPVSALLHSSTMVKAGVYIIVRLAPIYAGTYLSNFIALFGAFVFLATAALAAGQSNGKKILAYSTISNLALIIACAGINTPAAITAAILLILFHAISKALLFLCVGAIEQKIGSRDIEDMRGLWAVMPRTALITVIGVVTMMLPPFGMLMAKWMAIESAHGQFLVMVMLALGSGLTVLFWCRWAGILLAAPFGKIKPETQASTVRFPLVVLAGLAVVVSFLSPFVYNGLVAPVVAMYYKTTAYAVSLGNFESSTGVFIVYPLFVLLGLGLYFAVRQSRKVTAAQIADPYMCGEQQTVGGKPGFLGPLGAHVAAASGNYYLEQFFGEAMLSKWINAIALAVLVIMLFGGAL
uniref:NADH:ubiquinone oxidoreductase subunit 5 (Chain L)/multisubunit Na+/H+ antiporter, MnhA subunit n=1 Tax=Desulfovibrio sp. U5L TaxID=596152 RepID=I2PWE3_9BACT